MCMQIRQLVIIAGGLIFSLAAFPSKAIDLAEALDTTNLVWTTSGSKLWVAQTNITHDGVDAASSGGVPYPQVANLDTVVTGPGTLMFWWRATNQVSFSSGTLSFLMDGSTQATTPSAAWQQKTIYVGLNNHTCRWSCVSSTPPFSST